MKCIRCGKCCEATMMELSEEDLSKLEKAGHQREDFVVYGEDAIVRLRNVEGTCYFFDRKERACRAYQCRPLGCELYPVNCDDTGLVFVDDFCPAAGTFSKKELRRKGGLLVRHLGTIDKEAARRRPL
jgi:Fe-S-cluster containining protein